MTLNTPDQFKINNTTPPPPGPPTFDDIRTPELKFDFPKPESRNDPIPDFDQDRLLPTKRLLPVEKLVPPPESEVEPAPTVEPENETFVGEGEFMPEENIDLNAEGGESDAVPAQFVMIGFDNEIEVRNGPLLIREFVMLDQTPLPTELQPWVGAELTNESVREMILVLEPRGYGFPNQLSRGGLVRIAPLSFVNSLRVNTQVLQ